MMYIDLIVCACMYTSYQFSWLFYKVFTRKLEEVGRVLFLISLTQKIPVAHKQSHVSLLQEDLLRLPSFPRSAIDAEFSLFNDPQGTRWKAFCGDCMDCNYNSVPFCHLDIIQCQLNIYLFDWFIIWLIKFHNSVNHSPALYPQGIYSCIYCSKPWLAVMLNLLLFHANPPNSFFFTSAC